MSHHLRKKMLTCADKFVYALCKLHEKIPLIKASAEDLYEVWAQGGLLKSKSYNTTAYSFVIGPWNITRLFSTRPHVERGGMRITNSFDDGTFQRGKVTTKQVVSEMGPDRAGLSCPGSSAVATEPPKNFTFHWSSGKTATALFRNMTQHQSML